MDHSNPLDPKCTTCTVNYCNNCWWNFFKDKYECIECAEGAVFDPVISDCYGTCGAILPYSLPLSLGEYDIITPTCVLWCPFEYEPNIYKECEFCDFENCEACGFNSVT